MHYTHSIQQSCRCVTWRCSAQRVALATLTSAIPLTAVPLVVTWQGSEWCPAVGKVTVGPSHWPRVIDLSHPPTDSTPHRFRGNENAYRHRPNRGNEKGNGNDLSETGRSGNVIVREICRLHSFRSAIFRRSACLFFFIRQISRRGVGLYCRPATNDVGLELN